MQEQLPGASTKNKRPACIVCDIQTASIPVARGIASREKSAVRPFSIESDAVGLLQLKVSTHNIKIQMDPFMFLEAGVNASWSY